MVTVCGLAKATEAVRATNSSMLVKAHKKETLAEMLISLGWYIRQLPGGESAFLSAANMAQSSPNRGGGIDNLRTALEAGHVEELELYKVGPISAADTSWEEYKSMLSGELKRPAPVPTKVVLTTEPSTALGEAILVGTSAPASAVPTTSLTGLKQVGAAQAKGCVDAAPTAPTVPKVCPATKERRECVDGEACSYSHPEDCSDVACAGGRRPDCTLWHERYPLSQVYAARREKRQAERGRRLEEDALKYRKLMQQQKQQPPHGRGKKPATSGSQAASNNNYRFNNRPKGNPNSGPSSKPSPGGLPPPGPPQPWVSLPSTVPTHPPPRTMAAFPPLVRPAMPWPPSPMPTLSSPPMPSADIIASVVRQVLAQMSQGPH